MDKEAYGEYLKMIGRVVRDERESRGMSLRDFGLMVGVDYKRLFEIEHGGANLTFKTLYRIAEGMEMSPSALLEKAETQARVKVVAYADFDAAAGSGK